MTQNQVLRRRLVRLDREIERAREEFMITTLTNPLALEQRALIDQRYAVLSQLNHGKRGD